MLSFRKGGSGDQEALLWPATCFAAEAARSGVVLGLLPDRLLLLALLQAHTLHLASWPLKAGTLSFVTS
jgi:hypothetical protein